MQPHVKNYLESIGNPTYIKCELCQSVAVEIHHVVPRSKFGSKRKKEQNEPTNLIAVCRKCHEDCHANKHTKDKLLQIAKKRDIHFKNIKSNLVRDNQ